MRVFSRRLGSNIMLRIADGSIHRTQDQSSVLRLISNEFWRFIFGRSGDDITSDGPSNITFKDKDVELWTRISGNDSEKELHYVELVRI